MKIASLVVRIRPEDQDSVRSHLTTLPGVSTHAATPDGGRLIVLVEDTPGHAVTDSLLAIAHAPRVLGVTLAYEMSAPDEEIDVPPLPSDALLEAQP